MNPPVVSIIFYPTHLIPLALLQLLLSPTIDVCLHTFASTHILLYRYYSTRLLSQSQLYFDADSCAISSRAYSFRLMDFPWFRRDSSAAKAMR